MFNCSPVNRPAELPAIGESIQMDGLAWRVAAISTRFAVLSRALKRNAPLTAHRIRKIDLDQFQRLRQGDK